MQVFIVNMETDVYCIYIEKIFFYLINFNYYVNVHRNDLECSNSSYIYILICSLLNLPILDYF